jgi:cobalt/nickel transport system permease protein
MNHAFIDRYSGLDSAFHRLDPRVKIVGMGMVILFIMLVDVLSPRNLLSLGVLLAGLVLLSRVPLSFILKRSLIIIPFSVMIACFLPFAKEGHVLYRFDSGFFSFHVTREGIFLFMTIVTKSFLAIVAMVLLTATIPFSRLLHALGALKCPCMIVLVLSFMYRYVFVIEDEFMKMRQAKLSRSVNVSWGREIKTLANMLGVLFLRSYERAESVYLAMCSRGFNGGTVICHHEFRLGARDFAFLTTIVIYLAGVLYGDISHG